MPIGSYIEKPNGSIADFELLESPNEVDQIGMVTKRRIIMMMLKLLEKDKIIFYTRQR